ncbi:hypothetical protein QL285_094907 [Trifolium repens]|jgi:hypothetical protein|nr:hypothetical protein QL285_094907 [Trifolium repens]
MDTLLFEYLLIPNKPNSAYNIYKRSGDNYFTLGVPISVTSLPNILNGLKVKVKTNSCRKPRPNLHCIRAVKEKMESGLLAIHAKTTN